MRETVKIVFGVAAIVLMADAFGFVAWVASGQIPADNFYLGTITAHILRAIISII